MAVFANRTASLHVHTMCSQALKVQNTSFYHHLLVCLTNRKCDQLGDQWSVHACMHDKGPRESG